MTSTEWRSLAEDDLPAIAELAARVLAADGGLPLVADLAFLAGRYTGGGTIASGAFDRGRLAAAGAVRPVGGGTAAIGMVDPAARGRGLGAALLDWTLAVASSASSASAGRAVPTGTSRPAEPGASAGASGLAGTAAPVGPSAPVGCSAPAGASGPAGPDAPVGPPVPGGPDAPAGSSRATPAGALPSGPGGGPAGPVTVTVETESLTAGATELFASRGLRQVFAEDVMRFDLTRPPPDVALPPGVRLENWSAATAYRFFDVYAAAFAERPNFPGWPAARWLDWLAGDDEFRPEYSALAVEGEDGDTAFIACSAGWITQVGVRPDRRGRGLGAGLVVEALRRMRADGQPEALLDVNVDNPAGALYRRLGFEVVGRRARFAARTPPAG